MVTVIKPVTTQTDVPYLAVLYSKMCMKFEIYGGGEEFQSIPLHFGLFLTQNDHTNNMGYCYSSFMKLYYHS